METLSISVGALSDKLVRQFKAQGFVAKDWEALSHIQSDLDALVRLKVRGVIPSSAYNRAAKKLVNQAANQATRGE